YFPTGTFSDGNFAPERRLSWMASLLPYLEKGEVFKVIDSSKPWNAEENRRAVTDDVILFRCQRESERPKDDAPALTQYVGIAGVGEDAAWLPVKDKQCGFFGYERHIKIGDVTDGTSNTLMIVETGLQNGPWAAGGEATVRAVKPNLQPYVVENGQFG